VIIFYTQFLYTFEWLISYISVLTLDVVLIDIGLLFVYKNCLDDKKPVVIEEQ
jgi:hypothetical protein